MEIPIRSNHQHSKQEIHLSGKDNRCWKVLDLPIRKFNYVEGLNIGYHSFTVTDAGPNLKHLALSKSSLYKLADQYIEEEENLGAGKKRKSQCNFLTFLLPHLTVFL